MDAISVAGRMLIHCMIGMVSVSVNIWYASTCRGTKKRAVEEAAAEEEEKR